MLNRPETSLLTGDADRPAWDTDRTPALRLTLMWAGMLVALGAVLARTAQLQTSLQEGFASGFEQTYETREEIPARNGRILAADGSILAGEEERFDLQINFRLIQQPADERWLRIEALRNLDRTERKDKQKVEAEKQRVLARREELWESVATLTGRPIDELMDVRKTTQARVAEMKREVLAKRAERDRTRQQEDNQAIGSGWQNAWDRVQKELTEPPTRSLDAEPLLEEVGYHTIVVGVDADVKAEVEAHRERYPGLRIETRTRRIYPQGELASHLVGSRTSMTSDEVQKRRQQDPASTDRLGDPIGRSGLELKYESHLRGIRGMRRVVKNRRGETIATEELKAAQHGRDLVLTLDVEVQRRSEELLDQALNIVTPPEVIDEESSRDPSAQPNCPQGGCIVAIDVNSGAILAAASAPRYDLNLLVKPNREQWDDLMQDPRKPLFSRATHMALAPGSTFKVITAAAALESGKINPNVPIPCHGYLDRPDQHRCLIYRHHKLGHGDILLPDALCRSCNVYFFTAARRMGPQVLSDWAGRFGIGQATGVDLPSEGTGHLPSPDEIVRGNRRRWHAADTLGLAIGQADLLVTPLQMARVMAAIANGGQLVTPHFAGEAGPVAMSDAPSFRAIFPHPDPQQIPDLHPATLAQIRNGLDMVVNHPAGTAFKSVHLKEVNIAGKTGTAESGGSDHAWFAGYVPAEQPRVAFVVVLEHGGSGGKAAGPVAKNFVKCLLDLGLLTPSTDLARDSDR